MPTKIRQLLANRAVLIILQVIFISTAIALAVYSLRRSNGAVSVTGIDPLLLVAAIFLYGFFYILLAINWAYSVQVVEGGKFERKQMLAFFASQPYKYLPTSAFSVSARSIYSKKIGASKLSATAKAQLIEYSAIFASGLIIIALAKARLDLALLFSLIMLIAAALFPAIVIRYREQRRISRYLAIVPVVLAAWLVGGLSLFMTIQAVGGDISYGNAVYLHSATMLASIAAVLVPAGIGIREAILFAQNVSVAGVFVWRAVSLTVDIITGVLAIFKINSRR